MIESTIQDIPGAEITQILGVVRGNSVRARHVGRDIIASVKNLIGGEISEYAKLQAETREMANRRMMEQAQSLGADAVVNIRYTTSMIAAGASEILAYGTAVKLS
ncbi:MAG TPA: hypothetical protein DCL17_07735 [Dehalococcoidia bacterium]|nr:hypothetical protein [Dehalococcoidia bacterium]